MTIFDAIIIGFVEGLTEFLPISSTGHMIVVSEFLGLVQDDGLKSFEVMIQIGAILAVVFYYRHRLTMIRKNMGAIVVGSLPVLAVGYVFADAIKGLFSVGVVAIMFIVGGVIFLITEYFYRKRPISAQEEDGHLESVTGRTAIVVGLAQVLSLIPGTSRAGATIIGGLWLGLSRKHATEFSFLLAIPVMTAITFYDGVQNIDSLLSGGLVYLVVGLVTAFITAYFALILFVRFLDRYSFVAFGVYRIIFGIILLILFYAG